MFKRMPSMCSSETKCQVNEFIRSSRYVEDDPSCLIWDLEESTREWCWNWSWKYIEVLALCRKSRAVLRQSASPVLGLCAHSSVPIIYDDVVKVENFFMLEYFWKLFLYLDLLQVQVDKEMTLFILARYLMKLIHLGIKEEVLCDKDTDSGIKSTRKMALKGRGSLGFGEAS